MIPEGYVYKKYLTVLIIITNNYLQYQTEDVDKDDS